MSEADVDLKNFAVPSALDLESQRRPAIPGYRREVIHNTTTQNEYRPGTICYIPYDSGAAGAFCDPATVRLEGTVEVINRNYYCDAFNLPRCGWHALIQEFGIEIGGVLHELNRHYAECVELDMIKRGENRTPFYLTRENDYQVGGMDVGKMHINFVKPSMITTMGLPHGVQYPSIQTLTSDTYPDTISSGYLMQSHPFSFESWGRSVQSNLPTLTSSLAEAPTNTTGETVFKAKDAGYFEPSSLSAASFYDDAMTDALNILTTKGVVNGGKIGYFDNTTGAKIDSVSGTTIGPDTVVHKTRGYYGLPAGGRMLHKYCRLVGATNGGTLSDFQLGESMDSVSPGVWPVRQPFHYRALQDSLQKDYSLISAHNVVDYYANCQNVPCAIPIDLSSDPSGTNTIWGNAELAKPPLTKSSGFSTFYSFSLKLYSSLIGELAKVWFPELLVPQQKMRIRIRFQDPSLVFQTVMDPCRRVPGTSRDWYPNLGVQSSDNAPVSELIEQDPKIILSGIHPIMVSNYEPGFCYIDAIAKGTYPVPQLKMKALHSVNKLFDLYDSQQPYGADADTILPFNIPFYGATANNQTDYQPKALALTNALASGVTQASAANVQVINNIWKKILYEIEQNQEYGYPTNPDGVDLNNTAELGPKPIAGTSTTHRIDAKADRIVALQQYIHPTNFRQYMAEDVIPAAGQATRIATRYDAQNANTSQIILDPVFDWEYKALNWNPFCVPTPQYLPVSNPSDKRIARVLRVQDFVNENRVCFGTHYSKSKMQVRRSHATLFPLEIPDVVDSGANSRLTYLIRNVQLVTQQIVLPRAAGLSIISNALAGGLVSEANAWTEIETTLPNATSQKVLVNAAMAFCTNISFVFQPTETIEGDRAYGYRFGSYLNPFTAFDFIGTNAADYNYLGGEGISYYNEITTSDRIPFDIQLQLSSELIPRTPMTKLSRFLTYNRWGDGVFTDQDYAELAPNLQPSYNATNDMVVNTLQDGFWACHIPIHCLDDQTITSNPFFASAEISLGRELRGRRGQIQPLPITVPYVGSFHITFNLETFMGLKSRMRTGMPIVNNNLFLKMERAHMCRLFSTRMLAILEGDGKWIYERGGMVMFIK